MGINLFVIDLGHYVKVCLFWRQCLCAYCVSCSTEDIRAVSWPIYPPQSTALLICPSHSAHSQHDRGLSLSLGFYHICHCLPSVFILTAFSHISIVPLSLQLINSHLLQSDELLSVHHVDSHSEYYSYLSHQGAQCSDPGLDFGLT